MLGYRCEPSNHVRQNASHSLLGASFSDLCDHGSQKKKPIMKLSPADGCPRMRRMSEHMGDRPSTHHPVSLSPRSPHATHDKPCPGCSPLSSPVPGYSHRLSMRELCVQFRHGLQSQLSGSELAAPILLPCVCHPVSAVLWPGKQLALSHHIPLPSSRSQHRSKQDIGYQLIGFWVWLPGASMTLCLSAG